MKTFNVNHKWQMKKLSEVADINPKKEDLSDDETVSFIAMEDISNEGRLIKRQSRLYGEVKKGYTGFRNHDILLAKITPCFENGKRALVDNLQNNVGFGSTEFHVIRARQQLTIPRYLYYTVSTHRFRELAEANMTGSAGQKRVPTDFIRDYSILIPSLSEQQKIADILSTVDEQIDNVDRLIEKTKELKKGLMQQLLTKGIGHTEFKETEVGVIPKEWEVKSFEKIFNTVTDYVANGSFAALRENVNYKDQEDYAILIRLTDYNNGFKGPFVYVDRKAYDFLSKSSLNENDIIIANVGAYAGFVFRVGKTNKPMTLGPNAILVRSDEYEEYIYYWLQSQFGQEKLNTIISTTAQPKFNKTDFKTLKMPIPLKEEQKKIADILRQVDEKYKQQMDRKSILQQLKKGLMQQLLTGKIRVKVDQV